MYTYIKGVGIPISIYIYIHTYIHTYIHKGLGGLVQTRVVYAESKGYIYIGIINIQLEREKDDNNKQRKGRDEMRGEEEKEKGHLRGIHTYLYINNKYIC